MRTVIKALIVAATAVATMAGAGMANAVATYGNIAAVPGDADGVYFGTGNSNGNWTIDTTGGIEVALRAKNRATLATIDGSSGVYHANPGLCNPICGGAPKAAWNYEFSVNTNGAGVLNDYLVRIGVDIDPTLGQNFVYLNVLANWPDNSYWDGAKTVGMSPDGNDYGVQQSANPLFGDSGFMPGFNPNTPGFYDIELGVFSRTDTGFQNALAQTEIRVQVPEPGTLALMGLALFGIGAVRRRKA